MEGTVPTPHGDVHIYMDKKQVRIKSPGGKALLQLPTKKGIKTIEVPAGEEKTYKL